MVRPFASVPGPNGSMSAPANTLRDPLPRRQLAPVHQIAESSQDFFEWASDAKVAADQEGRDL